MCVVEEDEEEDEEKSRQAVVRSVVVVVVEAGLHCSHSTLIGGRCRATAQSCPRSCTLFVSMHSSANHV